MKLRTRRIEEWIKIDGDVPGESAEFLVHPQTPKEIAALLEKVKKAEWDKGQRFTDHNFYKFKIYKIFETIKDWKGVENEEGVPLPCTNANKEAVYLANPEFIDKVLEKADDLYKSLNDDLEKESKNLRNAQLGTETDT
jgi:hypothetical protein